MTSRSSRAESPRPARFVDALERQPWLPAFVAAIVAHSSALGGGFVWLDHAHITNRLALDWKLFEGFAGTGFYRPLVSASLSLDDALFRSALGYHVTTLLFHALAAAVVAVASVALGLVRRAALIAGLLFAVHPLSSEVAAAIAFRSEAMALCALLGLIVFHVRARPFAAASMIFVGGLCKETALVLAPLFVLALEVSRSPLRMTSEKRRLFVAEGLSLVALGLLRMRFAPSFRVAESALDWNDAAGTRLAVFAKSARAFAVLPWDRGICDAFPVSGVASMQALIGLGLLALAVVAAFRARGLALLFLLALLPSLGVVPLTRWWSPHYLYIPLAFVVMHMASVVTVYGRRGMLAAFAVASVFGVLTFSDDRRFRDDETLWTREVKADSSCREGHFYLAERAREREQWSHAETHYESALAERPRVLAYVDARAALGNLALVLIEQGQPSQAAARIRDALRLTEDGNERRRQTHNLAVALLKAGNARGAADALAAESLRPDALVESLVIRAKALQNLGERAEVETLVRRIRAARPIE